MMRSYENRLRKVAQALDLDQPDCFLVQAEPGETAEAAQERVLSELPPSQQPPFVLTINTGHPDLDPQENGQTGLEKLDLEKEIQDEIEALRKLGCSEAEIERIIGTSTET